MDKVESMTWMFNPHLIFHVPAAPGSPEVRILGLLQGMPGLLLQSDGSRTFSSPLTRKKGLCKTKPGPSRNPDTGTTPAANFGQSQARVPSVPAPGVNQPSRGDQHRAG